MSKLKSRAEGCAFCWQHEHQMCEFEEYPYEEIAETNHFYVIRSLFPVTPNHFSIIPKRCFAKSTDMKHSEWVDFLHCRKIVEKFYILLGIKAWNSGDNYGKDAGQSRMHFHYHYFDRRPGDVDDPRGGIRNFIPPVENLADYKDET